MRFGSLFSGVGGFDLGLERAGMTCAWQVEIDAKCQAVLERHWPNVKRYGDVRDVGRHNLDAVDLVCGGFPCQDVSVAGKREGLAGERSGLWYEFHRILAELAPRWVVVENVPGLLSSNGGRDFATVIYGLADLRYGVCWRVLDSQYFGVAQRRRRVFIVGHLGDGRAAEVLFESNGGTWVSPPGRKKGEGVAAPIKASAPSRRNGGSWPVAEEFVVAIDARNLREQPNGISGPLQAKKTGGHSLNYINPIAFDRTRGTTSGDISAPLRACGATTEGVNDGKADTQCVAFQPRYARNGRGAPSDIAPPLTAEAGTTGKGDSAPCVAYNWQSGGDVRHSFGLPNLSANQVPAVGVRRLTPTECERLQDFPDGWTSGQSDSARYKQNGNAVTKSVSEWLGRRILEVEASL